MTRSLLRRLELIVIFDFVMIVTALPAIYVKLRFSVRRILESSLEYYKIINQSIQNSHLKIANFNHV